MNQHKRVLIGYKKLQWGTDRECTFIGALETALQNMGYGVDYTELMGMSSAAFRMTLHEDWCPSAMDMFPRAHTARFLGMALQDMGLPEDLAEAETKQQQQVMKNTIIEELDAGRPVLGIDLVKLPDWGLITGYVGSKLLCRTYYDDQAAKTGPGGYVIAENFPWIIYIFEEIEDIPDHKEAILTALELAVEEYNREKFEGYKYGDMAYEQWIEDLQDEAFFSSVQKGEKDSDSRSYRGYWYSNGWMYNSLIDARYTAFQFLGRITPEFNGKQRQLLQQATNIFKDLYSYLWENWVYFHMPSFVEEEEDQIWIPGDRTVEGTEWTQEHRNKGAKVLNNVQEADTYALQLLSQVVDIAKR